MYSHVACDVMKERTVYLLKPSSLIWHLMPYLFLLNLLSASGYFCHLLICFANSWNPNLDRKVFGSASDLDPKCSRH